MATAVPSWANFLKKLFVFYFNYLGRQERERNRLPISPRFAFMQIEAKTSGAAATGLKRACHIKKTSTPTETGSAGFPGSP